MYFFLMKYDIIKYIYLILSSSNKYKLQGIIIDPKGNEKRSPYTSTKAHPADWLDETSGFIGFRSNFQVVNMQVLGTVTCPWHLAQMRSKAHRFPGELTRYANNKISNLINYMHLKSSSMDDECRVRERMPFSSRERMISSADLT